MADRALFIGWGEPVRGREERALQVFGEFVAMLGRMESDGRIEGMEPFFLDPHGGDLGGFFIVRGDERQCGTLLYDQEFRRGVAELLAAHLERRQQMIERLGIAVKTDLSEETYFTYQREVHQARRALLQARSMDAIRTDMEQFEEAPLDKWLGEFAELENVDVRITR